MRWQQLFADLESQFAAAGAAERGHEVADRTRNERADVTLAAHVWSSRGDPITVELSSGVRVSGTVVDAALSWFLLVSDSRQVLVPLHAVTAVHRANRPWSQGDVTRKLSLAHALRALARDRTHVLIETTSGAAAGLMGAVGADYCEVVSLADREDRRLIPFIHIMVVRAAASAD